MKKILAAFAITVVAAFGLQADTGYQSGTFKGYVTAIEEGRDSFTVMTDPSATFDNKVKMFTVSASRKSQLRLGDKVTVRYVEAYRWPLKTLAITVHRRSIDK